MATFKFDHDIDIHWNGYDIVGPAETVFSIPDQLYEEFESDLRDVEPSLTWIDTNEFLTLSNSVSASTLSATFPVALSTTTSGKIISLSSTTNPNGYVMIADGTGGVIFSPASTSSLTSVVGISPISTIISGGTVSVSIDTTALNVTDAITATTLRTYVKNSSGSTITKGQAVYVSGADGTNALIDIASASNEATSSKTLGILASTLTNNAFGYVIENGQLSNIDTSATTAGASIWLGNTPGSLVFGAPPAEPSNSVYLGVVTKANPSTGEILVKVQNGYEIDELHDVSVGTPTDLDIIQYKNSSGMWTKTGLTDAGIVTPTGTQTLTNKTLTLPSINNTRGNYTSTVSTASTTTVLTESSTYYQYATGTGASTYRIQLPNTSTLTAGHAYEIHNNSSNSFGILTSLGTSLITVNAGYSYRVSCIDTSTNSTSAWDLEFVGAGASILSGSGNLVFSTSPSVSSPSLSGTIIVSSAGIRISPTTIATSGGSTAVQTSSNYYIRTTGTTTHRLNLSASGTAGTSYIIRNDSTGDVTVNASGGELVATLKQGQGIFLVCLTTSGTTAASWAAHFLGGPSVTGTGSSVMSASPTLTGDVTLNAQGDIRFADSDSSNWVALQGAATIPSNVTWTLPSADGTSGQAITTNGIGALSFATISGATVSSFISSGTYTVPASASLVYVYAVGGGGGGGGGSRANGGRAGGGAGVSWRYFRSIDLGSSTYSVTVGTGAISTAGSTTSGNGTAGANGGNTTFGTNLLVALGGYRGLSNNDAEPAIGRISLVTDSAGTLSADGSNTGSTGLDAIYGPSRGGRGATTENTAGFNGGSGFAKFVGGLGNGGAGGTAGTAGSAGGDGQVGGFGDGGGGGGASSLNTVNGANGGNGAFPGGGGGGGGKSASTGGVGGTGAAGGDGWCLVVAI